MKQTLVALALLLAAPLLGLAAAAAEPPPLAVSSTPADGSSLLALCAPFPTTAAPQGSPQQRPEFLVGAAAVTCSRFCGITACRGLMFGDACLAPGGAGVCTPSTTCSSDHLPTCVCDTSQN